MKMFGKTIDKAYLREVVFNSDTPLGRKCDIVLMGAIALSLVTAFVETLQGLPHLAKLLLTVLEYLLMALFTLEYLARLWSSERKRDYVLSFFGIIDLLAILPPYLSFFFPEARYMLMLRSIRFLRVFRVFRLFTFINEGFLLIQALQRSFHKIAVYFLFVLILVTCLGTLMYIVEGTQPGSAFTDIGTSIYWAIVTMTTVGYGDITPVTLVGRLLSAFVMLLGYTIIAVPTGIVSATFIDVTTQGVKDGRCPRCDNKVRKHDKFCSHCGEKL